MGVKVLLRAKTEQTAAAKPTGAAKRTRAAKRTLVAKAKPTLAATRTLAARPIRAVLKGGWLHRHWVFVLAAVPALVLRAITMVGFRWALWFNDSYQYVQDAVGSFRPDQARPSGYSFYLRVLEPFHNFAAVTISQHLMGLATGVMIYALLLHRFKTPSWIATLAALPALYDAFQIQLEHLLMADAPFEFLVVAAVAIVLWRPKPSMIQMVIAGLLFGLAAITRSIGLPLLGILVVYLLIRRIQLRVIAAAVIACAVPAGGYVVWFHQTYHAYDMTQSTGIFLYSRVMAFADCRKFSTPPEEMALCTTAPRQHRMISQLYIWSLDAPLRRFQPPEFSPLTNKLAKDFATRAIKAQPLDYARVTWDDTWRSFAWNRKVFPDPITYDEYVFASASGGPARKPATGHGFGSHAVPQYASGSGFTHVVEPYAGAMRFYQRYVFVPGTILGLLLAVGLCGMALAWRRLGGEILLPWALSVAMIVIPAATVEFDYRYVLPAVPFACLAAAMVFGAGNPVGDKLLARRARRSAPQSTAPAVPAAPAMPAAPAAPWEPAVPAVPAAPAAPAEPAASAEPAVDAAPTVDAVDTPSAWPKDAPTTKAR